MRRGTRDLLARLVLAVCLLAGVSPAQGWVLCFEPDGSAALEAAAGSGCEGCPGDEEQPVVVISDRSDSGCCACLDIPLPRGSEEPGARLKSGEPKPACVLLLPAFGWALCSAVELPPAFVPAPGCEPRPAPRLALIRTVILRV